MLCCGFNLLMLADCASAAPRHAHTALCDLEAERAAQLEAHLCLFMFFFFFSSSFFFFFLFQSFVL